MTEMIDSAQLGFSALSVSLFRSALFSQGFAAAGRHRCTSTAISPSFTTMATLGDSVLPDLVKLSDDKSQLTGMQKWIAQYRAKRPGLEVLQHQIDEFMAAYDAREEQTKLEKEAAAAEDGWTVVVNKGGRKKTTDDSGIAVGAVASAAAAEHAKKKQKTEVAVDFYRFQRREVRRNEVLELQKKFEEDKKRIAKLKAARKFRPF